MTFIYVLEVAVLMIQRTIGRHLSIYRLALLSRVIPSSRLFVHAIVTRLIERSVHLAATSRGHSCLIIYVSLLMLVIEDDSLLLWSTTVVYLLVQWLLLHCLHSGQVVRRSLRYLQVPGRSIVLT